MSWRTHPPTPSDSAASSAGSDTAHSHAALLLGHDHDGLAGRVRQRREAENDVEAEEKDALVHKTASKKLEKMIAPYLAHHIPQQYNPLGGNGQQHVPITANTKYCYRHRPDMLCRRQADEPTMEQLQEVRSLPLKAQC